MQDSQLDDLMPQNVDPATYGGGSHSSFQDFVNDNHREGHARAIQRMFTAVYMSHYRRNPQELGKHYIELLEAHNREEKLCTQTHWLITINAPTDTPIDEFENTMKKALDKVWIRDPIYNLEFGPETKHPHYHLLCKKNKPKSQVIVEIYNTFKHLIPSKAGIDVRAIRAKDYDRTKEYVLKDAIEVEINLK